MSALRSHPFFESITWATLWTEPAPPIVAGLVQREYPLGPGQDKNWQDVGATWDALVMDDDASPVGDDIDWADDAEGSSLLLRQRQCDTSMSPVDISLVSQVIPGDLDEEHQGLSGSADSTAAMPITIPSSVTRAESPPSGSPESSSDGDRSVERVAAGLQTMKLSRFTSDYSEIAVERERGRSQAPTPIQGNTSSTIELYACNHLFPAILFIVSCRPLALNPEPNEKVIYRSIVEDHSARRRANRLLKPIPGAQIKPKARELILTNYRLICVKAKTPPSHAPVKLELFLKEAYDREKEKKKDGKEIKGILESADLKGGRDFIVFSVGPSLCNTTMF